MRHEPGGLRWAERREGGGASGGVPRRGEKKGRERLRRGTMSWLLAETGDMGKKGDRLCVAEEALHRPETERGGPGGRRGAATEVKGKKEGRGEENKGEELTQGRRLDRRCKQSTMGASRWECSVLSELENWGEKRRGGEVSSANFREWP